MSKISMKLLFLLRNEMFVTLKAAVRKQLFLQHSCEEMLTLLTPDLPFKQLPIYINPPKQNVLSSPLLGMSVKSYSIKKSVSFYKYLIGLC